MILNLFIIDGSFADRIDPLIFRMRWVHFWGKLPLLQHLLIRIFITFTCLANRVRFENDDDGNGDCNDDGGIILDDDGGGDNKKGNQTDIESK